MSKTHWKHAFDSPYLGSWDLPDFKDITLDVDRAESKMSSGLKEDSKFNILYFKDKKYKPMLLNATNCKALAFNSGSPNIEDWKDFSVTLYVEKVKAFGELHDALRIRKSDGKLKPTLKIDTENWNKVVKYLKGNPTKWNVVENKYNITNKKELEDAIKTSK